ncbi:hypothetical protein AB0O52_20470 [Arthrobacter sp. NPDC080073]
MEVTLTVDASDGTRTKIIGVADTYEQALAEARKQIPEGGRAVVIWTDHY